MSAFRLAALIPTFNNPDTIGRVVDGVRRFVADVWVVDDGGGELARERLRLLEQEGKARVVWREKNGGKGAAVKTGLSALHEAGFTHALQIDADDQHETGDIPRFIEVAARHPSALILGSPEFDASAPRARRMGRVITQIWTHIETLGRVIADPMCGFRVYPIAATLAARVRGDAMDFDPEVAVSVAWGDCPVINLPTRVRYHRGGVSHFRLGRDNLLISWMHTRMVVALLLRVLFKRRPRRLTPA